MVFSATIWDHTTQASLLPIWLRIHSKLAANDVGFFFQILTPLYAHSLLHIP